MENSTLFFFSNFEGFPKGTILPGVTRRSIIEMCSTWPDLTVSERKITMSEVMSALSEGRLLEMFGSGTAAVVSPVGGLHYEGRMVDIPTPEEGMAVTIMSAMSDIYYGKVSSPWAIDVEEWNVDPNQVELQTDADQPELTSLYCRSWLTINNQRRQHRKCMKVEGSPAVA